MKQFFRYHRGEFNGKYLNSLVTCPNYTVQNIIDEYAHQNLFQWKLEDEITSTELFIRENDMLGIAKIAGLFHFYLVMWSNLGSIRLTTSNIVEGTERSERGLHDIYNGVFKFVRTNLDTYPTDIVTQANSVLKSTLVPEGTEVVGYLPYGVDLYDGDGNVLFNNLLQTPPVGVPYTTYYGDRFLVLEQYSKTASPVDMWTFKLLLECVQIIRYNGISIDIFLKIVKAVGAGYIYDIEIIPQGRWYLVNYSVRTSDNIFEVGQRVLILEYFCKLKFKLFLLQERDNGGINNEL